MLDRITLIRQNEQVWKALGQAAGVSDFLAKNVRAPFKDCKNCPVTYLQDIDEYLADLTFFTENYANVPGYNTAMTMLGSKAYWNQVEPEAFVLRVLRADNERGVVRLEAEYPGCRPDVALQNKILCEYKSWTSGFFRFPE